MADILLGLIAIIAGITMLFAGRLVLRFVLPIWGFFAGFAFGAGLVSAWADESFLGTAFGWILGLVFAVILSVLAYLYYYVAVIIAMGAFGFAIGSGIVVALGIDWNWVAVLIGLGVGVLFGLAAVFADMPMVVLIVASSLAGAAAVVGGIMLWFGQLNTSTFDRGDFASAVDNSWAWSLLMLVLALIGIFAQTMQRAVTRSVHDAWYADAH